jgi:hypothetical protein
LNGKGDVLTDTAGLAELHRHDRRHITVLLPTRKPHLDLLSIILAVLPSCINDADDALNVVIQCGAEVPEVRPRFLDLAEFRLK